MNRAKSKAYEQYRRLAGEVEARNVSARINMTPEERRATLLSETEDVAREDQIFLRDGVEIAMAGKKRGATKSNTSKLGQPTTANGNPPVANLGAKLNKNYESAIADIEKKIKAKGVLSGHEFLHELDNALTGLNEASTDGSGYVDIGDGFTIRVSDHYSNANTFKRFNNTKKNYGIVIKLKNRKFKSDPNVDYVEVVYYPDKLDGNRQLSILDGVKRVVKTKDIAEMPTPDDTHTSENVRYSLSTPEMDASYLDAVERGDMETAQRMVMEAAEKAGYINDESWRMNHRAPRKDEENANPFNTEKIVPEDFWEHPEWYTNIRHSSETRESYYAMKRAIDKYKRLKAEGKTDEAENVTITMYRGVDKTANKREASFRNGDWITPSRSYALLSAPNGKARVISQEVKLKDIWWDGNSIDEWGYDDGANYGYRDTKNNRKLLDPVTYDDAGNIIPLSERFNLRKEDIRYSLQTFDDKVQMITYEVRHLGIQSSVMVAENTSEFISILKDMGADDPESYKKCGGIYLGDTETIVINGDHMDNFMRSAQILIHENTHSITKTLRPKLHGVLSGLNEEDILAYRDEKFSEVYKNDTAIDVLDEIISYFVGDIPYNKLIDFYQGALEVEDIILSDFGIRASIDERYWPIYRAIMPIIAENITIQKEYYNG